MAQIKLNATYGLTGTLPAVSGVNLTALNGTQVTSGTVADARISALTSSKLTGNLPALNGSALTALNASNVASGTLNASRYSGGKVLQYITGTTTTTVNNNTQNYATSHSLAITPSSSSSKILIIVSQEWRMETAEAVHLQICRGSTVIVQTETGYVANGSATNSGYFPYQHIDSPNTTNATTYSVKHKATTSNKAVSAQTNSTPSNITLLEIA